MEKDIEEVKKIAHNVKKKLEELDKDVCIWHLSVNVLLYLWYFN